MNTPILNQYKIRAPAAKTFTQQNYKSKLEVPDE